MHPNTVWDTLKEVIRGKLISPGIVIMNAKVNKLKQLENNFGIENESQSQDPQNNRMKLKKLVIRYKIYVKRTSKKGFFNDHIKR